MPEHIPLERTNRLLLRICRLLPRLRFISLGNLRCMFRYVHFSSFLYMALPYHSPSFLYPFFLPQASVISIPTSLFISHQPISTSGADDQYCSEFNITLPQLLRTPESSTTSAYARYILDIGTQGDILELYVAIAACLIGYGEVGLWLQKQVRLGEAKVEGNLYKRWMEDYGGEDFLGAVDRGIGMSPPPPPPPTPLHSFLFPLFMLAHDNMSFSVR
jgi:hypothetical protein